MEFHVPEMSCGHCKAAIEKAVEQAGGSVTVDLDARTVRIDGLSADAARAALAGAGFEAQPA